MRGGKGGRKRKSDVWNEAKPGKKPVKTKLTASKRSPGLAPKKGSRKNTEFGGSSTRDED
jgi:hypothetical protein